MHQQQPRDFLIRNMPFELYKLLENSAKEHHRSKTQEAIVAIKNGLTQPLATIKKPKPFKWGKKITGASVRKAIQEGRE